MNGCTGLLKNAKVTVTVIREFVGPQLREYWVEGERGVGWHCLSRIRAASCHLMGPGRFSIWL